MTRWLAIIHSVLAATVFGLTPEAGAFGFSAAQNQPARPVESAAVFPVSQPANSAPVSSVFTSQEPSENQGFLGPRYLDTDSGRFWSMDLFAGVKKKPLSLHKYLYAHSSPVNGVDPSGFNTIGEMSMAQRIQGIIQSGVQRNFRLIVKNGTCELVEMGLEQGVEFAIAEAGLYLFEHGAAGGSLDDALGKAGKPYAGQTTGPIAERIKEHGKRVRRMLATFKVEGPMLDEAEQWLIDTVKEAQGQRATDALGSSNPGNQLANRRNQVKELIGKALPMCK